MVFRRGCRHTLRIGRSGGVLEPNGPRSGCRPETCLEVQLVSFDMGRKHRKEGAVAALGGPGRSPAGGGVLEAVGRERPQRGDQVELTTRSSSDRSDINTFSTADVIPAWGMVGTSE